MRCDTTPHQCYGGIDLHARTMVPLYREAGRGDHAAPPYEGGSRTVAPGHRS
jgi:hypothetical protein